MPETNSRRRLHKSIAGKLVAIQSAITLIIALIIGTVSHGLIAATLKKAQNDRLAANATAFAGMLNAFLQTKYVVFETIANGIVSGEPGRQRPQAVLPYLKNYQKSFKTIVFKPQGDAAAVSLPEPDGANPGAIKPSFMIRMRSSPNRILLADFNDYPKADNPHIRFGIFKTAEGNSAYLQADVSLDLLDSTLKPLVSPKTNVTVTDRNGQILYSSQPLSSRRVNAGSTFGATNTAHTVFMHCADCLVAKANVATYGWTVYASMSYRNFNMPLTIYNRTAAMVIVLSIAAIVLLILLIARRITRPLAILTETAYQVAHHVDLNLRATKVSDDELGDLADSINHMLAQLHNSHLELDQERAYTENIIASINDAVFVTDTEGTVVKANLALSQLTGLESYQLIGVNLLDQPLDATTMTKIKDTIGGRNTGFSLNTELIFGNHAALPAALSGACIRDTCGRLLGAVFVAKDITDQKQCEERLNRLANYDHLTGLPNRLLLLDRMEQALARLVWRERKLAVMFLDLDRFKHVNDTLGHAAGDRLIRTIAERLNQNVRDGDTVARLGGDEFVVLLNDLARVEDAAMVAEKIIQALRVPVDLNGRQYVTTSSIGISLAPEHSKDGEKLLKLADTAMYTAKRRGRDNYAVYSPDMLIETCSLFRMEVELRQAFENNEFQVYYQPVISSQSGRISGVEALMRWHSHNGIRKPDQFIALAEETGLIVPIGNQAMLQACSQMQAWHDDGFTDLTLAINLSDRQFHDPGIVNSIKNSLKKSGLSHDKLHLELTEGVLIESFEQASTTINALKNIGTQICVDDFGTGYSSLTHLKRFKVDVLKIDREFVAGLPRNNPDVALTESIIELAHKLGIEVVAEGVETGAQEAFLKNRGADFMQGYRFGPPMPAHELTQRLHASTPLRTRLEDSTC